MYPVNAAFPLNVDASGRTATASTQAHVRQMIEQVLLTTPGERVNRPRFGCELKRLVFLDAGDEILTAGEAMAQSALSEWLGRHISVEAVTLVRNSQGATKVKISYVVLQTSERGDALIELET